MPAQPALGQHALPLAAALHVGRPRCSRCDHMPAEKSSGWPFGMALASSQARASARKAASSGVSSKSTARSD